MVFWKKTLTSLSLAGLITGGGFFAFQHFQPTPEVTSGTFAPVPVHNEPGLAPEDEVHAGYAGSAACKECHAAEFESWEHSNHGLAERVYMDEMDKEAFSPKQTLLHGKDASETFLDADGVAKVLTRGLDDKRREYVVERIIGNDPLRQFLVPAPGGRLQTMDVSYDPHKKELFDVYGEEERNPGDWGSWTGQGMNWNAMCAACHNTRLRKNYDPSTNSYHTSMAEMSVGCEACHGPMKNHVEWQKKPPVGYSKDSETIKDPTIREFSRDQMMETCAACHARRGEVTGDLIPGESFYDHFSLVVTDDSDTYHPDGQVRDENYEYASFLSSSMHHAGVRCVDCHNPHSATRLIPGNMLCMRCHSGGTEPPAPVIDPTAHSHHGEGSAGNDCTSCHMPLTTYMQRDPRHDHGFTIPDPLLTLEFGTPNACNRCHTDKDAQWSLDAANEWYGEKLNRPTRARAQLVARARLGDPQALSGLVEMLKTEKIAAWRASASHLLTRWSLNPLAIEALLGALSDESPLVREAALRTLVNPVRQGNEAVATAIKPLLEDPLRSVRVAAAWAVCPTLDLASKAGRELTHMLDINSDQPTGRMQLSQFAYLRGDTEAAVRQIRKAIEWDPNSPPFHHDLAILLSTMGDTAGAIKAMQEALRLDPRQAEYHYKLALAWSEAGNLREATASLTKTVELDPSNARAWYNLGLAFNSLKQPKEAEAALLQAERVDPNDAGIPYALATILARQGRREEAIAAATRVLQINQQHPDAMRLIRSLYGK